MYGKEWMRNAPTRLLARTLTRSSACVLVRACLFSHTLYLRNENQKKNKATTNKKNHFSQQVQFGCYSFYSSHFDTQRDRKCERARARACKRTKYLNCVHYSFMCRFQQTGNFGTHAHTDHIHFPSLFVPFSFARAFSVSLFLFLMFQTGTATVYHCTTHLSGNMCSVF